MAVPYKLLKTGGKLPHNKDLRAVLDVYETVGIKLLGDRIVKATSLTMGDLVGALEAIRYELVEQLMLGNRVHLPGLGYFSLSVKGELYEDPNTHKFRLRNPYVRTVNFRPEKELLRPDSSPRPTISSWATCRPSCISRGPLPTASPAVSKPRASWRT